MRVKFVTVLLLFTFLSTLSFAGTIHGFVREKETGEPVIMGNVWIKDTSIGTTTNLKGYYVLPKVTPGKYQLCVQYIGFKTEIIDFVFTNGDDIEQDVYLEMEALEMEEVVVTADREDRELDVKPSQINVQMPQIRRIPAVGEADLFRAIQMLPGVATLSDFSAGLYVRGGSPDQNLIMLDNIDVYNPNHMFGFFSTFNTDAIKSVELLKGGYQSKYGGRLSSVLNVLNKEGNRKEFKGVARVSLLSASTTLEGPWKKGSWMVSGRRTYLDLAGKLADFDLPYYFYDGHGKINFDIDKKNQASLSFYMGNDLLNLESGGMDVKLDWGNKTFSSQWTHIFNSKWFSHFVFAGSRFDSEAGVNFDNVSFGIVNKVQDLAAKGMLTYTQTTNHSIDFGFEAKMLEFDMNFKMVDTPYNSAFKSNYYSAYVQDNFKLNNLTIFQTGLRFDHYEDGNYFRIDPRFSVKQIFTDKIHATASYGKYHQYLNMVQAEGLSFADIWLPVDETFEPGEADHYILGLTYDNNSTFSINVEGYYKDYLNIAEYRQFRQADEEYANQTAAQNFLQGTGEAYGADVYIRNNFKGLEGWFGYTLAFSKKKVNNYNFGLEYYPTYDRRHTFTLIEDYKINDRWSINFAFKYGSGQPYTESTARYTIVDPAGRPSDVTLDADKNTNRLPDYHRLDIGIFYNRTLWGLPFETFLQVVNVYNHKNVWLRSYDTNQNPATVDDITMIPILPTFGFSVHF